MNSCFFFFSSLSFFFFGTQIMEYPFCRENYKPAPAGPVRPGQTKDHTRKKLESRISVRIISTKTRATQIPVGVIHAQLAKIPFLHQSFLSYLFFSLSLSFFFFFFFWFVWVNSCLKKRSVGFLEGSINHRIFSHFLGNSTIYPRSMIGNLGTLEFLFFLGGDSSKFYFYWF